MSERVQIPIYAVLSLTFASRFFPLTHPTTHAILDGDPALACWTVQWLAHALLTDPRHLFAGNVFYPYAHAILLSDPMLTLAIMIAPLRPIVSNPWVGYNIIIVVAYFWSCISGAALARAVTRSETAAFWGGIFWGFLFYRVHHIGHIQVLSFQWMPLAAVCAVRLLERPTAGRAALFAIVFAAQALVGWYLAVATAVVVAVVLTFRPRRETLTPRLLSCAALAVLLAAALIVPVAWQYRAAFGDSTLAARAQLATTFGDAVRLRDYLTPPAATLIGSWFGSSYEIWRENTLYIGFVPLALCAVALAGLRRWPLVPVEERRWIVTGAALVVVGYVLALGFVSPSLGVTLPLGYAARLVPPLAGLRATQRLSLVAYVGVLILSSVGVQHIAAFRPGRWPAAIAAAVCAVFLFEVFPARLPFRPDPRYAPSAPDVFIARYQRTRSAPLVVLHLPIWYGREPYPTDEAIYMVDSTWHWARILNGFSGAEPAGFLDRMHVLSRLPAADSVAALRTAGVDLVAVHNGMGAAADTLAAYFARQPWARLVTLPNGEFVVLLNRD